MKENLPGVQTPFNEFSHEIDGLFIRKDDYYKKFLYSEILYVEASGSYCYFYFKDKPRVIVSFRLALVEEKLPERYFARVHNSFILNLCYVDTFVGNSLRVGKKWFPIGRVYRKGVLARFNILGITSVRGEMEGNK